MWPNWQSCQRVIAVGKGAITRATDKRSTPPAEDDMQGESWKRCQPKFEGKEIEIVYLI